MISAVIITFNEAGNIGKCLEALYTVADEILVIDSFSTDDTTLICQSKNATVIQRKWEGYSATKNFGNQQARYDFILSVDADEVISEELASEILKAKNAGLNGIYEINRLSNYCGHWIRHSGWYPDRHIRLFNRNQCNWDDQEVHESLKCKTNPPITILGGHLFHYSYKNPGDHRERVMKYARLGAEKIVRLNKKHLLARSYINPLFRWIRMYFFQLGFLDGKNGLRISYFTALEVHKKYKWAYQLKKK